MKLIKGETLEDQIKSVDIILSRFSRRLRKTVTGIITPFPISNYVQTPVDGTVLKYMFPAEGKILSGVVYIEDMPKSGIDLYTVLWRGEAFDSRTLFTRKNLTVVHPNIEVIVGDRLTVSVVAKGGAQASGIWISLLWEPKVSDAVIKKFLIEELNKQQEEVQDAEASQISFAQESRGEEGKHSRSC